MSIGGRLNGYLPLGLIDRCIRLIEQASAPELVMSLHEQRSRLRSALGSADTKSVPGVRAAVSELAMRAAFALVVTVGSTAVLGGQHGQRFLRESAFLSVAGSRPEIKHAIQQLLASSPPA